MRFEAVVNEYAVSLIARAACQRQSDEIAKASRRHCILIGKETIVGLEADLGAPLHRFGYERCAELTRFARWDRLSEENPDVPAES